ncbi:MAG: serine hydrolase domain-containing protein [Candidatus Polarisedimenticolia bacterium]
MRGLLLGLLLVASGARATAAGVPETPAGRELVSFLESYNARRLDEERWKRWFSIYGPLEVKQVAASADTDLSVWAQGGLTGGWVKLRIVLEEAPPHKLDGIGVTTGYLPEMAFAQAPLTERRLVEEAGSYLDRLAAEDYFSGTVLIARHGKPILARAWGQASRRHGVPNGIETKYNLGSLTKVFTAVAVAKLVDEGRLRFDDTIAGRLPGYASRIADRATIHQLLTHTSGTGRGAFHAQAFSDRQRHSVSDLLAMTIAPPDFEPGTGVRYSNEAWIILAAIIEKASGMDYDTFVRKNVYDPAGMKDSGPFEADQDTPGVATGYTRWRWHGDRNFTFEDGPRRSNDFMRALKGNPSCCSYATAPDLLRFANALLENRLLSAGTTQTLLAEHVWQPEYPGAAGREGYAYGFELVKVGDVLRVGKAGSIDGVSTRLDIYPALGYTVIVLSNYDSIAHLIVADHLGTLVMATRGR